jgi:hypothetical protein
MINPTTILVLLALAGPVASWGLTSLNAKWEREAAVSVARGEEQTACKSQVTAIQTKLNNAAAENVRLAEEAARALAPTPAEAAELQDLCNSAASCRDRKKETQK